MRFALRGDVRGGQGLHFGETSPADFRLGLVLRARSPNLSAQVGSGARQCSCKVPVVTTGYYFWGWEDGREGLQNVIRE